MWTAVDSHQNRRREKRAWRSITKQSTGASVNYSTIKHSKTTKQQDDCTILIIISQSAVRKRLMLVVWFLEMERATAVIVGGNEVDECKVEASSLNKTPVGTGGRRQPKRGRRQD